jgi:hypothetical protein
MEQTKQKTKNNKKGGKKKKKWKRKRTKEGRKQFNLTLKTNPNLK